MSVITVELFCDCYYIKFDVSLIIIHHLLYVSIRNTLEVGMTLGSRSGNWFWRGGRDQMGSHVEAGGYHLSLANNC